MRCNEARFTITLWILLSRIVRLNVMRVALKNDYKMGKSNPWKSKVTVYDSAPEKEFDELELWRRDVNDSVCRSATFKILSASELIDPSGDGEWGRLGGVSFGRTFDMLFLKLLCGGMVVGRGGAGRKLARCVTISSAVSIVVGKSTNFCWIPGPMSVKLFKINFEVAKTSFG